jgi:hypothetical protein
MNEMLDVSRSGARMQHTPQGVGKKSGFGWRSAFSAAVNALNK